MRQVTLVMLYGPKPSNLSELITECQERIMRILGDRFQPYDLRQVHATLVSLERISGPQMTNLHFLRYRGRQEQMDIAGLLNFIRTGGRFPFQVQIGGFQKRDYPFVSQNQKPYERSFSILGDEVVVALIVGWPLRGEPSGTVGMNVVNLIQEAHIYPNVLDEFRQSIQTFNILHRYHAQLSDVDNDFYFRIGLIHQSSFDCSLREKVEGNIRNFLSTVKPIIVEISVADVYVASYHDETLPLDSALVWSIAGKEVTPEFIWKLYEESL